MSNPTVVTLVEGGGGGGTDVNTTTTTSSSALLGATPPMVSFVPFQACQPEKCTTPKTVASMDDDGDTEEEEEEMPWDDPDWIPLTKSGRQKTPNVIRGELQRFIDSSAQSQTSILRDAGITPSSFAKFMNRKYYKHAESAYQNESYWRGARYLAKMAHQEQMKKKSKKHEAAIAAVTSAAEKRKASTSKDSSDGTLAVASKKLKKTAGPPKETAAEAEAWMRRVLDFEGQEETEKAQITASLDRIFDACTVVVKNIKQCLVDHPGLTKVAFCQVALGGCSPATLNKFLMAKGQNGQASMVYPSAYAFFERIRIMKGEAKSKARRKNEQEKPGGFDTSIPRQTTLVMLSNW